MAEAQIMNAGWHPWRSYDYPRGSTTVPMWEDNLNYGFSLLLDFRWLDRQTYLKYAYFPAVQRQRGMTDFGGVYDYAVLNFDPEQIEAQAEQIQRQRLQLAIDNSDAPNEPDAFNVRIHSGHFTVEDMHWIELLNPLTYDRERLSPGEFRELADTLTDQAESAKERAHAQVPYAREQWARDRDREFKKMSEKVSSALLLASLFSEKRIPFGSLLTLMFALPGYGWTYPCVKDLPAGISVDDLGLNRLVALYGWNPENSPLR